MSNKKCPYAKALAKAFDIHFDCLDCPSSECYSKEVNDAFGKNETKGVVSL